MRTKPKAIVAGGGIGGLSAALGLANKGCSVTVLQQADQFGEIGAGIQIGPNAFHALDYLGGGGRAAIDGVKLDWGESEYLRGADPCQDANRQPQRHQACVLNPG